MDLKATIEYYDGVLAALNQSLIKIKQEIKDAESKRKKLVKLEEKAKEVLK